MKPCVLLLPYERVARPSAEADQRQHERSEIEGEAPQAYACGGGDASPNNCAAGSLFAF